MLVPTRELATQVYEVLRPLARAMGLWVTTIYGGVSYGPQVTALRRRTDIAVATPGRLADLINQGECDLSDVEIMVIDEADQMADLGFLPIVRRLLEATPADGQRMLFSATLDAAIDVLVRRFLNNPATHSVNENSSPAEIEHHVITIDPAKKLEVLATLTGGDKRSLVFTRTKHGAERLARQLTELGIPAAELHGNLRQGARARNLAAFSSGIARVMVATDIAARGIHVDGIDLVIHADPPAEHKAYVHRSGRTARGGADGVVVTLQMRSQARDVTAMMRKAGITPHTAVAADPESDVLRAIAGPPAPRVSVSGKVSELVRPEDRLSANGSGGPGGRGGYGRGGAGRSRDDRPRRDRQPAAAGTAATARRQRTAPAAGTAATSRRATATSGPPRATAWTAARARTGSTGSRRPRATSPLATATSGRPASGATAAAVRRRPRSRRAGVPTASGRPGPQTVRSATAPARHVRRDDRPSAEGRPFRGNRDDRNTGSARPERSDWYPRENRPAAATARPASTGDRARAAAGGPPTQAAEPLGESATVRPGQQERRGGRRTATVPGASTGRRRPAVRARARDRSGYSAGRSGTFKTRDHGPGRHF